MNDEIFKIGNHEFLIEKTVGGYVAKILPYNKIIAVDNNKLKLVDFLYRHYGFGKKVF